MQLSETTIKQVKKYVITRAKYGICGASNIGLPQMRALDKAGLIVRGGCGTIDEFTDAGIAFVKTLFTA